MNKTSLTPAEQRFIEAGNNWIDQHRDAILELLTELVNRQSLSGSEGTADDPTSVVGHLWNRLQAETTYTALERQQIPQNVDYAEHPRENIYATIEGSSDDTVILTTHTDIVAEGRVDAWPNNTPFEPTEGIAEYVDDNEIRLQTESVTKHGSIRDQMDRVWKMRDQDTKPVLIGRGVYDNKASIACLFGMLCGIEAGLSSHGLQLNGNVVHGHLVDEEIGQLGIKAMVGWDTMDGWLDTTPFADTVGVVLEGSYGFVPVIAHRGLAWITLRAEGESTHAATPHLGHNPVVAMGKALAELESNSFKQEFSTLFYDDPILGTPTVAPGTTIASEGIHSVQGDTIDRSDLNTVPSWCEATLDVRVPRWKGFPEERADILTQMANKVEIAANRVSDDVEFTATAATEDFFPPIAIAETNEKAQSHPLVDVARESTNHTLGYSPETEVAPGVTDATFLYHGTRAPTLVEYGPAGAWSHEPWEFVETEQVIDGAKTLLELSVRQLGVTATE